MTLLNSSEDFCVCAYSITVFKISLSTVEPSLTYPSARDTVKSVSYTHLNSAKKYRPEKQDGRKKKIIKRRKKFCKRTLIL